MFSFLNARMIGVVVILLVIASAVGYHFWKINSLTSEIVGLNKDVHTLQTDLQISEQNNSKLKIAIEEQKASIQRIEEQRLKEVQANNALQEKFKNAQGNVNKLKKILSKHNLNYLSLQKPGLIETRVNRGTAGVGQKIEEITQ